MHGWRYVYSETLLLSDTLQWSDADEGQMKPLQQMDLIGNASHDE
jgi:hypothetical protein